MEDVGRLVAAGRTSDVYEFGPGAVVKIPRSTVPSHWAAKEARFTAAVRELGAPAPEVLDVVEIEGRDAIVFERVDGPSMWDLLREGSRDATWVGQALAEVHMHILGAGLPTGVAGWVSRMQSKIDGVRQLSGEDRRDALAVVERLPRGAALLHGDLHPGNVLMSPSGPVVIDWFDAAIGHPIADVVRSSLLIRPFRLEAERPHMPAATPAVLRVLHHSYISDMRPILAGPVDELGYWESVVAVSRLVEEAEMDESPLLELWRTRGIESRSPLLSALLVGSAEDQIT